MRTPIPSRAFALGLALASWPYVCALDAQAQVPTLVAARLPAGEHIAVDGALDEAAWDLAEPATEFVERTPHPGEPPPVGTTLRVLFDDAALYVSVECALADGEHPRALVMTRDSERIWSDDAVSLKIDARRDHRTTLGFVVSASGAQLDYLALDNGRVLRREYDAIWESAVRVEDSRWVVEVRIPAVSLGLSDAAGARAIGLQVSRDHAAHAATYDWAPMPPEFGPFSALHYGVVEGLALGAAGMPVATTIYSLGEYRSHGDDGAEHALRGSAGLDSFARVSGDVWLEVTALTDFAQVDLDDALVNLDRFPLFFPERRPFFLNGLDVLDFGVPGLFQPFYSRRIGLDGSGRSIPVLGGVKVYGRDGPLSFGILDVVTDERGTTPAVENLATRARVSLGGASYVGALALTRVPFRWDGSAVTDDGAHGTAGIDLMLRFAEDDRMQLYAFGAATAREARPATAAGREPARPAEAASSGTAAGLTLAYLGENLQPRLSALWIDDDFDAELGFVRRTGASRLRVELPFLIRPSGFVRRIGLGVNGELQTDHLFSRLLYVLGEAELEAELEGGWSATAGADYVEDTVAADFEVHPGRTIRAGTYTGAVLHASLYAPEQSNPGFGISYSVSNAYFGGELHNPYAEIAVAFGPWVTLEASADVYYATLPNVAPFWAYGVNALLRVTPSTNVQLDLVGRLDGAASRAIAQARLRWRYLPGSDLYVVWREDVGYGGDGAPTTERTITVKTTFRFDLLI